MNSYCCLLRFKTLISSPAVRGTQTSAKLLPRNSCFISQYAKKHQFYNIYKTSLIRPSTVVRSYVVAATKNVHHYKKEDHTTVWITERIFSIGLLSFISVFYSLDLDSECLFCLILALHIHWGLEATLKDYLRPSVIGHRIPRLTTFYAASVSVTLLVGLLWVSIYGKGIVTTVKQLWYLDTTIERAQK